MSTTALDRGEAGGNFERKIPSPSSRNSSTVLYAAPHSTDFPELTENPFLTASARVSTDSEEIREEGGRCNAQGMTHPPQAQTREDSSPLHGPKPAPPVCVRGSSSIVGDWGEDGLATQAAGDRDDFSPAKDSGKSPVLHVVSTITVEEGSRKMPVVARVISSEIPEASTAPTLGVVAVELPGAPESDAGGGFSSSSTEIRVAIRDEEEGRENPREAEGGCDGGRWIKVQRMSLSGTSPGGSSQSRERIEKISDAPAGEAVAGTDPTAGCLASISTRETAHSPRGSRTARNDVDGDSRRACGESEAVIRDGLLSPSVTASLGDGAAQGSPVAAIDPIRGVESELTQRIQEERDELRDALRMVRSHYSRSHPRGSEKAMDGDYIVGYRGF